MLSGIRYIKPRQWETTTKVTNNSYTTTTITKTRVDKLKDSTLRIPMSARVHPEGQRQLARLTMKARLPSATNVMNILVTLLVSAEQEGIVKVSCEDLVIASSCSTNTVLSSLSFLIEHEFIAKLTKQTYRISPRIAWFGNQIDWAVELKELDERDKIEALA